MDNLITLIIGLVTITAALWFFFPERGLLAKWRYTRRVNSKTRREDAIKHIFDCETSGRRTSLQSLAGTLHISVDEAHTLISELEDRGLVEFEAECSVLTNSGRDLALHLLRAHRLWERYLADETGFTETEWHDQADRQEHTLTQEELDQLSARLSHPTYDPHGDPIPTAEGELGELAGTPLTAIEEIDSLLQIVHIEDEPETVYAQIVAEGLHPGMSLRLLSREPQRIRFWAGGDEHVLAPLVAANIHVIVIHDELEEVSGEKMNSLAIGEQAEVLALAPSLRGAERRRMMDLGLLPGTLVRAEYTSAGGDPVAYRIRGALIALRAEQAGQIIIQKSGRENHE
ncbi:MAG: metal-dependent transcriptional regulator [Anaerolineales bacterium]|jgi:DtxR family Mn-dependent transcriptional regulator